jgi:glycosyltransferase involved in cell wall biosynthesis
MNLRVLATPHIEHYTIGLYGEVSKYVPVILLTFKKYNLNIKQIVSPRIPIPRKRTLARDILLKILAMKYEIIHVNNSTEGTLIPAKDRLIVTEHGFPDPSVAEKEIRWFYEKEQRNLIRLYEIGVPIVTISNYAAKQLYENLGVKVKAVVYHGVLEMFRADAPKKFPERHKILWVSRLVGPKEPFVLLDAIKKIKNFNNFEVYIRGDGPLKNQIRKFIRCSNIEKLISTVPPLPFNKIPDLYKRSTIFVHTCSREPFGLSLLEAMASGLPVIIPDKGGACEIADDAALKFKAGDPSDLADKILALMLDSELYENLSRKSLERSDFFSWKKAAGEYLELYEKIL